MAPTDVAPDIGIPFCAVKSVASCLVSTCLMLLGNPLTNTGYVRCDTVALGPKADVTHVLSARKALYSSF